MMKRKFNQWLLIVITWLFVVSIPAHAADKYLLDPNHSYVLWHINHFGFSNPSGKWLVEGNLNLDSKKLKNSQVDVSIKLADIVTGIPELDKHLKSKLFFDVAQFPTATFKSTSVKLIGRDRAKVEGMLNLHGVTKPVTLKVKLNKKGVNPINDKMTLGFTAATQLKRSDFDMKALIPGVGDDVKIDIEVEANKITPASAQR